MGFLASILIAFAGIGVGALSSFITEYGATANANNQAIATAILSKDLREAQARYVIRAEIVETLKRDVSPERLPTPQRTGAINRPVIYLIIDDMGLDSAATRKVLNLPGPLTTSFLPYAPNVKTLVREAQEVGADIMLHLPMEPVGSADPGPHALKANMTGAAFVKALEWNLAQFDGYIGVNNHMGSKLTSNVAAMKTVLAYIKSKDLFFLDSLTTGKSVVRLTALDAGLDVFERDIFIDAQSGSVEAVRDQLLLAERIAAETGFAIAIGHPRKETIEALGPWLASAPARGFKIAPISDLLRKNNSELLLSDKLPNTRFVPGEVQGLRKIELRG